MWGTATKVLLEVTRADGSRDRLCVKGGFVPELRAIMAPGYRAEALFYRDIAPQLDAGVPRCHHADVDDGQGIVVMDDLIAAGGRTNDPRTPMTVDQVADGLRAMAAWHARADLAPDWLPAAPYYRPIVDSLFAPAHWDTYIGQTTAGPVLEVFTDRERLARAYSRLWAFQSASPATFVHGDANPTNVYFDAAGSHPLPGLAVRLPHRPLPGRGGVPCRRAERRGPPRARAGTAARLPGRCAVRTPSRYEQAWESYRRHAIYGAVYCLTPEEMQPADRPRRPWPTVTPRRALDLESLALLEK